MVVVVHHMVLIHLHLEVDRTNTHGPGSFAGGGNAGGNATGGTAALQNTGSGGGGMERAPGGPAPQPDAGNGGSGLVLIAYPT